MKYYDWHHGTQTCRKCGWSGLGSETKLGEVFDQGSEYDCPACGEKMSYVMWPLVSETKDDPRASDTDRKQADVLDDWQERVVAAQLKSTEDLPDLQPGPAKLIWDAVERDDGHWRISIRDGNTEIWQELSCFEEYPRFIEIARLLWDKYGATLRDLEPTRKSWFNLGGDYLGALGVVDHVREQLARGERPI